jgi:uncharacterized repeat protein (TIGR01451 family)
MKIALHLFVVLSLLASLFNALPARAANTTYFVSTSGNDSNNGLTTSTPFKTIAKVNALNLQPGDKVLFKCGEVWRGEMLFVSKSGASGNPITFGSYPDSACDNKPILSGTQLIGGWAASGTPNIYVATLSATTFPNGINQLFRNGSRLTMGRWPNLNNGDGGYVTTSAQPSGNQLTANTAPPANLTGGTLHLKVIRWSMVNRDITGQSGSTLTLSQNVSCPYTSNCTGWGFFVNNALSTLDSEGEWYYNKTTRHVYLYTTTNPNSSTIEGSVVLATDDRNWGAINLGDDLDRQVHDVVIDNFDIRGWFRSGIVSPTNLHPDENSYITIRNNTIRDVDDTGINLWSWVWGASDGQDGWRGGNNIVIQNNLIDGANSFGIHTPSRVTIISGNTIRNIGLIANLNEAGMGCGKTGSEGTCTENGAGLRIYVDNPSRSGYGFTARYNRFENIAYNGIQIFGHSSTITNNFFDRTCIAKGDGGAINTFGTGVHDIQILSNIITDTIGNTDGTHSNFRALLGFGIYIDQNSANITSSGNTVARSTGHGILYQNSNGNIQNNTLFDNATEVALWADQIDITGNSSVPNHTGNILLSKINNAGTLAAGNAGMLGASDYNGFYHANRSNHIRIGGDKTLAQWRSASGGKDLNSTELISSTLAQAELFYNETTSLKTFALSKPYKDLNGNLVVGTLTLQPYTSKILYPDLTPIPRLTIQATGPGWVHSGERITITLNAGNLGTVTANNVLITNTLPSGAAYISGGTRVGNVIRWTASSLAPNASVQVSFVVTATTTVINNDYRVSASGEHSAVGVWIAVMVDPKQVYLPAIRR